MQEIAVTDMKSHYVNGLPKSELFSNMDLDTGYWIWAQCPNLLASLNTGLNIKESHQTRIMTPNIGRGVGSLMSFQEKPGLPVLW